MSELTFDPRTLATPDTSPARRLQRALAAVVETPGDPAATLARVSLGLVMLPHGAQKLFGWFGGHGPAGTLQFFQEGLGIPPVLGWAAILAESLGAVALVVGLGGRLAAATIAVVMAVAVATVHGKFGFFMNWSGAAAGEGFEYHVLAAALALVVVIRGSGAFSVDRLLARRLQG
jgi:putative oxidoreductase